MQASEQLLNIHRIKGVSTPTPSSPTSSSPTPPPQRVITMRWTTKMWLWLWLTTSSHGDTGACCGSPAARRRSGSG